MANIVGTRVLIACWIVTILAAIFLGFRIYVKLSRRCGLWKDDYLLIISWVAALMQAIFTTVWVSYGYGMQAQDIDPRNMPMLSLVGNILPTFGVAAASLSKTSFAITLLKFTKGWMKNLIWLIILSMNIVMWLSALFVWISCTPVAKGWHPDLDGACWNQNSLMIYFMFASAYSATMDFALSLLPSILFWNVQMKRKEKIGVIVAMSVGFFAGIVTIIKTVYIPQAYVGINDHSAQITIWSLVEPTFTIIAASISVLRVFFKEHKLSIGYFYRSGTKKSECYSKNQHYTTVVSETGQARPEISHQPDDCSDRGILGGQNIVQTCEISVEYTSRNDVDSISYEMGRIDRRSQ
ncbi:hypothetical protein GQ44DRAFT_689115 [Phaeosphaeriaceae sp. PMI808]|nr:hypothetical protein GQ44DRAFT_689115 [Phaeosphaeriaceae sp. PMI808]